uniref:Guided entry of tail-anchored proteins factor 1 n=2 Tax=Panagrolaimus sp. JU765 TaxID=591449 RepID=A0AC34QT50_9BILA
MTGLDTESDAENLVTLFISPAALDVFLKLNWFLLKLLCTFLGIVAVGISLQLIDFDVKQIIDFFHRKTPAEIELEEKFKELKELNEELSQISEMDEFANYHRKRRVILKKQDEYDKLALEQKKLKFVESVKLNLACRSLVVLMAFAFSYYSKDLIVARVDAELVWPFGFLLNLPWVFAGSDETGKINVSLFNFLILVSIVKTVYQKRRTKWENQQKTSAKSTKKSN